MYCSCQFRQGQIPMEIGLHEFYDLLRSRIHVLCSIQCGARTCLPMGDRGRGRSLGDLSTLKIERDVLTATRRIEDYSLPPLPSSGGRN